MSNLYNKEGKYIVRNSYSNAMLYTKQLLKEMNATSASVLQKTAMSSSHNGISYSNSDAFQALKNPNSKEISIQFTLDKTSQVQLSVWDTQGRVVTGLVSGVLVSSGSHQYRWNYSGFRPGVYLIKYLLNGNVNIKKVIIQ